MCKKKILTPYHEYQRKLSDTKETCFVMIFCFTKRKSDKIIVFFLDWHPKLAQTCFDFNFTFHKNKILLFFCSNRKSVTCFYLPVGQNIIQTHHLALITHKYLLFFFIYNRKNPANLFNFVSFLVSCLLSNSFFYLIFSMPFLVATVLYNTITFFLITETCFLLYLNKFFKTFFVPWLSLIKNQSWFHTIGSTSLKFCNNSWFKY